MRDLIDAEKELLKKTAESLGADIDQRFEELLKDLRYPKPEVILRESNKYGRK